MKKNSLTSSLSAVCLSFLLIGQSAVGAYAQTIPPPPKPALSQSDETAVMNWIAARVAAKQQPFCYRESYGRGVGVPLSTCSATQQKNGALCYPECKAGYGGAGPVCWQECPSGYVDTGAFCHIDKALTNKGGWHCSHRKWGVCWVWSHGCDSGYTNVGLFCALTTPHNPAGWKGDGLDLIKGSYGRGAGYPMSCKAGLQEDAALCYTPCHDSYHGVGPVCWQNCPSDLNACGVGCANSKTTCASDTANMVVAPVMMVGMIAADVFSGGAAGEAVAGAKESAAAGEEGAEAAKEAEAAAAAEKEVQAGSGVVHDLKAFAKEVTAVYKEYESAIKTANNVKRAATVAYQLYSITNLWVKNATSDFAKLTTPETSAALNKAFAGHPKALQWVEDQYAKKNLQLLMKQDGIDTAQAGLNIASTGAAVAGLDPTGVSSVVAAYANPKCSLDTPFPSVKILY